MLKDFNVKPVLNTIKNPQANTPVERLHQVVLNILVTKDLDNKVFDHIDPWGENLATIAWAVRDSYHRTLPFIYKNHDTLRYMKLLYTKLQTLLNKQDNLRSVFIYKILTLFISQFFMEFLKLAEGRGVIFISKKIMHSVLHLYMQKMYFACCF